MGQFKQAVALRKKSGPAMEAAIRFVLPLLPQFCSSQAAYAVLCSLMPVVCFAAFSGWILPDLSSLAWLALRDEQLVRPSQSVLSCSALTCCVVAGG